MRRADFNDRKTFTNLGDRSLENVHPATVVLYEQIATRDCYQVQKTVEQYRRSHSAANPTAGPGPWMALQP